MEFKNIMKEYLGKYLSPDATFRDGQLEALEVIKDNKETLIVQKTGWGKSLVYFLGTKYLKDYKQGSLTLVVSPLISLMRDQVRNAEKFGLNADMIVFTDNYREDFNKTVGRLEDGDLDILFISPERFANEEFALEVLPHLDVTLFVIDEAHCISNWGHDFRPDYMRLVDVYESLEDIPLVLTTATANDRVVEDIESQFGNRLITIRGNLTRDSLELQVNTMPTQAERLAWLKDNVPKIEGSGIIYCATVKDTLKVSEYLSQHDINVEAYHGSVSYNDRILKEDRLINNKIKALVSTNALGMGFDKGDLAFVIHFQAPGSLVSYYQEIGRAGRKIPKSKIVLLHGVEDERIQRSFIDNKIGESQLKDIFELIKKSPNGLKRNDILNKINESMNIINSSLKILLIRNYIFKKGSLYVARNKEFKVDLEKEAMFKEAQLKELKEFTEFINTSDCYMQFIANKLNDNSAIKCGKCANCLGQEIISSKVSESSLEDARQFLNSNIHIIKPRARKPYGINIEGIKAGNVKLEDRVEEGRYLTEYGIYGYGIKVADALSANKKFSNELVNYAATYLKNKWTNAYNDIDLITYIPSYENDGIIKDFAERLASKLKLPFEEVIKKTLTSRPNHNKMSNGVKKFENAYTTYHIEDTYKGNGLNVLVIDDIISSGMTMFASGIRLKASGFNKIYPFALSSYK